jgi:hypothetical protein
MVGILISKAENKFKVEVVSGRIRLGNWVLDIVLVTFALSHVWITKINSFDQLQIFLLGLKPFQYLLL